MSFGMRASLAVAASLLLFASLALSQPVIHFSSSNEMMPSMMQDLDDLFDAIDSEFAFETQPSQTATDDYDSFSFNEPEDQFLPAAFHVNSPRFIQLPSLGGLFSQLRSVAAPQMPKPISQPMRLLSDLDFSSVPRSSVRMSSMSLQHRDGQTIRTETTWGADGSEHTTMTVTPDIQEVQNGLDINDLLEAFSTQSDSDDDSMFQLFDLDGQDMPCDMHSNTQRLSAPADYFYEDEDEGLPMATVQVMVVGDFAEEDAKQLAQELGLASDFVHIDVEEEPKRREPITEEEAEDAVKASLADMDVTSNDLASDDKQKDLSAKIAEKLNLDPEDVTISKQGEDQDEDQDKAAGTAEVDTDDEDKDEDKKPAAPAEVDTDDEDKDEDKKPAAPAEVDTDDEKDQDDEGEVQKLQEEIDAEQQEMQEVKEKAANTKLALEDEADEKKWELLNAKDDLKRAEEVVAEARADEKSKEKDVDLLSQMKEQLAKLAAVH